MDIEKEPVTFDNFDCLELKAFCERLEGFLMVENDYVEGSLVVALNAGFGSGKTTFIEMWRNSLLARREAGEFVPMPIVLNAWESDHCGDPLLAILAGLVEIIDVWEGKDKPDKAKFKEAAKDVLWFATALTNEVASKVGLDAMKAGKITEEKRMGRKEKIPDFIDLYQQRVKSLKVLKSRLNESFGGQSPKVIVFVDELDRCRPDYAVSYLETIKHVFDTEGMVFVLAVDYPQLISSATALFGGILDEAEYFRKFCHRTFDLPVPTLKARDKLLRKYTDHYLAVEGKRMCLTPQDWVHKHVHDLESAFAMRPRQIQETFRIVGHTLQTMDSELRGKLLWGLSAATLLLSCLRVSRALIFNELKVIGYGLESICNELVAKLGKKKAQWWIQIIVSGMPRAEWEEGRVRKCLRTHEYIDTTEGSVTRFLDGFRGGWPGDDETDHIQRIAMMIEEAKSFGDASK